MTERVQPAAHRLRQVQAVRHRRYSCSTDWWSGGSSSSLRVLIVAAAVVVRALRSSLSSLCFSVQWPARALFAAVVALLASPVWESVRL